MDTKNSLTKKQLLSYARDLATIYESEKKKRDQLEVFNRKLRATLDGVRDGVVTLDEDLCIIELNRSFAVIMGVDPAEMMGKPIREYLTDAGWQPLLENLAELKAVDDVTCNPDQKKQVHFRVTRSPILNKKGQFQGLVLTFQDETAQKRIETLKSEFLSIVSHEIKTPITGIKGYLSLLEMLNADRLEEEEKEYFRIIDDMTDRLTRTVDELLDMAQSSPETYGDRQIIDIRECIHRALDELSPVIDQKQITINVSLPDQHHDIYGFADMLQKSIQHLIENAIGFSPDSSAIDIYLQDKHNSWQIKVVDRGQGISQENIDRVFDPFFQEEYYLTRTHEGIGLGLPIVKKTALMHGGSITLDSAPGKGTTARLQLPKATVHKGEVPEKKIEKLKRQISVLHEQNIQYAKDLARTYTNQKNAITQLKKTNEQLVRSDKLATMGQMLASITHELNNMLNPIIGYTDIILKKKDTLDPKIVKWTLSAQEAAWRATDFLATNLDFSRQCSKKLEKVNIVQRLNKTLQFLDFRIRKAKIVVEKQFPAEKVTVVGNPGEIEQVFTNLIINAVDAMKPRGRLNIIVKQRKDVENGEEVAWVEIKFRDTGSGIPQDIQEKIFEPFFTTKEEGKGTGLGMFIIHSLVDKHGGTLELESEVGKGTTFTLNLPLTSDS